MTELPLDLLFNAIIFILFPLLGGTLMTKLKLPRMIGYIISGMLLGLFIKDDAAQFLTLFGQIGLILLLFTIGLETNLAMLKRFGKMLISIGVGQMFFTALVFFMLTSLLGMTLPEAAILSFAFSLSSTALVSKIIQERGEENSLVGELSLGVLLLQDLAVIPFMILLSSLGQTHAGIGIILDMLWISGKTIIILSLVYFFGQKLAPYIFAKTAKLSRELLNLLTILCVVVAVFAFTYLGLSPAIAAFISGVIIGGTMQHYQIFSQMRPLRDMFTIIFFVVLGATIDITQLATHLPSTLLFVIVVIGVKFIVTSGLFTYFKFHTKTSFSAGLLLAQVGEFAFVVLQQAYYGNIVSNDAYYFGITTTLVTIGLSPILIDQKDKLYSSLRKNIKTRFPALDHFVTHRIDSEPAHIDALNLSNHVVICGYGRVGSYIGRALSLANIPCVAIDYNFSVVEEQKRKGLNIIYGDPSDIDILDFADTEKALMLVAAVPDVFSQEMIILNAKILNPKIIILSRVAIDSQRQRIKDLGAEVVVQPEFEAALSIIKKVFIGFRLPKKDIIGKVKRLKLEHGMA